MSLPGECGRGILTAGHAGEAARVVEAVQGLAGVIRSVHTFPALHASPCRSTKGDTNATFIRGWGGVLALCLRRARDPNPTPSVNT